MDYLKYIMESDEEALRLDVKTASEAVEKQALWAGVTPGMRIADLGCGSGKTTAVLHTLAQPGGKALGIDFSAKRFEFAQNHYRKSGAEFRCMDVRDSLEELGTFDLIWIRFVLEYYRQSSFEIVKNVSRILKPGGILCLIDLDHNCLSHCGLSPRLEKTLFSIMGSLERKANFDPYAGRRLYSFLYDLSLIHI